MRTVIEHLDRLVTMDDGQAELADAYVVMRDGAIEAIGTGDAPGPDVEHEDPGPQRRAPYRRSRLRRRDRCHPTGLDRLALAHGQPATSSRNRSTARPVTALPWPNRATSNVNPASRARLAAALAVSSVDGRDYRLNGVTVLR